MGDFEAQVAPYRQELKSLCYRMSGSVHDAEDLLQDALLRAWSGRDDFKGDASLRTWLYRITMNVCLSALERRRARSLPQQLGPPGDEDSPMEPALETAWLTPAPHEDIALAFLAALQLLPARQRAVVILHDVLGWRAAECAELLDVTVAAVNSALQRARETLGARSRAFAQGPLTLSDEQRVVLQRYVRAWETADLDGLVSLLHQDATLAMPPIPAWLAGATQLAASMRAMVFASARAGQFSALPAQAHGLPALALYRDGRPYALQLLELSGDRVSAITAFLDVSLFDAFGLPASVPTSPARGPRR